MNQASKHGFLFGLLCPGDWRAKKEATMYSYNGYVLPKLPEWDKETYPYAVIHRYSWNETFKVYFLAFTRAKRSWDGEDLVSADGQNDVYLRYDVTGNQFGSTVATWGDAFETDDYVGGLPIWTNYNILNTDNTLFLSASDPVPVYE